MLDTKQQRDPFPAVDAEGLLRTMDELSAIGGGDDGSMNRVTLTSADGLARDWLVKEFHKLGLTPRIDAAGNMFGMLEWAGPDAPLVMTGSHLDSQPNGGRFDGAYGVVAALKALEATIAKARAEGVTPRANFALVNWTNEEGARFQPSLLGSSYNAGAIDRDYLYGRRDGDGVTFEEALEAIGYKGADAAVVPDALIELHIEGSAVLEKKQARFGIFSRFWGATKYRLAFIGEQAHTGPTPMAERRDALLAAAHLMAELRAMADRSGTGLHTSVGRLEVLPNSPNVVPARATLFLELRSADPALLAAAEDEMKAAVARACEMAKVEHEVIFIDRREAKPFDPRLVALAERTARAFGHEALDLSTIGGHDAVAMAAVSPAVVLAVPSVGGVIHHPTEFTTPEDRQLGTELLAAMLWEFCTKGRGVLEDAE